MTTTVLAFFSTFTGQATAAAVGLWILGLFGKSIWYGKIREAVGRGAEAAGVALSALGNSKLKVMWNPIENVVCDFLFFAVEQFAVGLRKDNPAKMARQLDRLESVGSDTRAEALGNKLEALGRTPAPLQRMEDAEIMARAVNSARAAQDARLRQ